MNVREKLQEFLIQHGMFMDQAKEVMELAIPVLEKQAADLSETSEGENTNPYIITWESPSESYPDALYQVWWLVIKPIALKWIDDNKPMAWFREVFV